MVTTVGPEKRTAILHYNGQQQLSFAFITQLEVCRVFLINIKNFHSLKVVKKVECDNSNANEQQNVSLFIFVILPEINCVSIACRNF